jgi:hypothetical protein
MIKVLMLPALVTSCIPAKYAEEPVSPPEEGATDTAHSDTSSGEEGSGSAVPAEVTFGPVQVCTDPLSGPAYEEQGLAWNVDTEWFDPESPGGHEDGPSLAMADANEDGFLDWAVLRMEQGDSHLYMGEGNRFRLWPAEMYRGRSGLFVDLDLNGRLDLLVGGAMPYSRLQNSGDLWIQGPYPELDPEGTTTASVVHNFTMGDFDSDGVTDLYAVRTASPFGQGDVHNDRLIHLTEDGMVVSMDAVPEAVGLRHGFDGLSFDADGDGDLDVYLAHDHGATVGASTLLRNDDGVFVDATDDCFCGLQVSAKGVDVADFNRDGQPDLFVTGAPLNTLLSRIGDGWVDVSDAAGIRSEVTPNAAGWGGVFMDVDNDGYKDIFLAQGDRWNPGQIDLPDGSPARFDVPLRMLQQSEGHFSDVAPALGLEAEGSFRSVLPVDLNADGVEDLIVTQTSLRTLVFVSQGCTEANWIEVTAPLGSRVTVESASGTQTDWSRIDRGYESTAWIPLHFGLGVDATVDAIVVDMPGGGQQRIEGPIEARRVVRFTR